MRGGPFPYPISRQAAARSGNRFCLAWHPISTGYRHTLRYRHPPISPTPAQAGIGVTARPGSTRRNQGRNLHSVIRTRAHSCGRPASISLSRPARPVTDIGIQGDTRRYRWSSQPPSISSGVGSGSDIGGTRVPWTGRRYPTPGIHARYRCRGACAPYPISAASLVHVSRPISPMQGSPMPGGVRSRCCTRVPDGTGPAGAGYPSTGSRSRAAGGTGTIGGTSTSPSPMNHHQCRQATPASTAAIPHPAPTASSMRYSMEYSP